MFAALGLPVWLTFTRNSSGSDSVSISSQPWRWRSPMISSDSGISLRNRASASAASRIASNGCPSSMAGAISASLLRSSEGWDQSSPVAAGGKQNKRTLLSELSPSRRSRTCATASSHAVLPPAERIAMLAERSSTKATASLPPTGACPPPGSPGLAKASPNRITPRARRRSSGQRRILRRLRATLGASGTRRRELICTRRLATRS